MNSKLLLFLERHLGASKKYSGEEYYFVCPLCNRADNAKKLAIKLDENAKDKDGNSIFMHWHCWRDNSHKGNNLYTLLKKVKVKPSDYTELKSIIGESTELKNFDNIIKNFSSDKKFIKKAASLPEEFKSLLNESNNPHYKNAKRYILNRGITEEDIIKYNIGYCDEGKYAGYIIIPSYDSNMNINYFVARSYYKSDMKYKNPPFKKDTVFNELYINWNEAIILCEGVFDAIAIKRNAIPILGKYIQPQLKMKIIKNNVKKIYVMLDKDAIKDSMKIIEEFIRNGVDVYYVSLPEKDPGELGLKKSWEQIKVATKMKFEDLIKMKLNI